MMTEPFSGEPAQPAGRSNVLPLPAPALPTSTAGEHLPVTPARLFEMCRYMVDGLFGKKHWARQWVLGLCEADAGFAFHLADQPRGYVHFLCLVRLALLQRPDEDEHRQHAIFLRTQSKKKILQNLCPDYPAGLLGLLPGLQKSPMAAMEYLMLLRALEHPGMQKMLQHKKHVKRSDLALLALCQDMPEELRHDKVISHIREYDDYARIMILKKFADHVNMELTPEEITGAMGKRRRGRRGRRLGTGFVRKLAHRPFPGPPWPGNKRLKPVASTAELEEAADRFKNCAMSYSSKVRLGYSYFYICERPQAIIEVKKDAIIGWGIGEMEGKANRDLSLRDKQQIILAFSGSGFYPLLENGRLDFLDLPEIL